MQLDVRKIIDIPGASIPFEYELSGDNLDFPAISSYKQMPRAHGRIFNEAGVLRMTGEIEAELVYICDRCATTFERSKTTKVDVVLAEKESEENPDLFALKGETVDLDEVLSSCFIMDMDMKILCSKKCKGLCPTCGKNLNLGPCKCRKELDPRFAVLEQLLDK
ncbi:MAG: DUF177 domain-containing protein [Oscillospiraceae bacterium]|nr:DUF177 domain-containing protein [Oscillospiraceae bacterium]